MSTRSRIHVLVLAEKAQHYTRSDSISATSCHYHDRKYSEQRVLLGQHYFQGLWLLFANDWPKLCHQARSKTISFVFLDTNSYNRLKYSRTCFSYLLYLRRPLRVRIESIPSFLKDIRRMNLLAYWKWCIPRMLWCSYKFNLFMFIDPLSYLWTSYRSRSLISELLLEKEEWVSVLKLSTTWNMTEVCRTVASSTAESTIVWPDQAVCNSQVVEWCSFIPDRKDSSSKSI